jgi:hypothetical protein
MEPNLSKDRAMHERGNPSFYNEFIQVNFLRAQFVSMFSSKYRSTYCKSGDLQVGRNLR